MRRDRDKVFLMNEEIIKYEVEMARVDGKVVLEIGGGTGNLSKEIRKRAKFLYVVEKDKFLAEGLSLGPNVKVINEDFLKVEPFRVDVIMGNIPYSISSKILFRLVDWDFDRALICVQREFAERMVACPGTRNYGRLSVMTQIYFKPIFLKVVPRGNFRPVPKVDSAIVILFPRRVKKDKERDELITKLFSHKNKTVSSALKAREFDKIRGKLLEKAKSIGLEKKRIFQLALDDLNKLLII